MTRRSTISRRRAAAAVAVVAVLAGGGATASSVLAAAGRVPAPEPVAISTTPAALPSSEPVDVAVSEAPTTPAPVPSPTAESEAAAPKHRTTRPLSDADLVAARQVAADFAVAYGSYSYDEDPATAAERLARWATPELAAELQRNSGATAGLQALREQRQVAVANVETVSTQRIERDAVQLLVVVRQEITSTGGSQQLWPSYTTRVTRGRGGWRVASLQP